VSPPGEGMGEAGPPTRGPAPEFSTHHGTSTRGQYGLALALATVDLDDPPPRLAWLRVVGGTAQRLLPGADPEPLGQVFQWMPPPTGGGGDYYEGP
jgi:hypothetical protein